MGVQAQLNKISLEMAFQKLKETKKYIDSVAIKDLSRADHHDFCLLHKLGNCYPRLVDMSVKQLKDFDQYMVDYFTYLDE
jgi:hypothetical protein